MRSMSSIEYYGAPGWYLVLLPGVFAAGLLALSGLTMRMLVRLMRRSGPASSDDPSSGP